MVGRGSYAKVVLVRYKADEKPYVLKVLKKAKVLELHQTERVQTEKDVMVWMRVEYKIDGGEPPLHSEDDM